MQALMITVWLLALAGTALAFLVWTVFGALNGLAVLGLSFMVARGLQGMVEAIQKYRSGD